MEEKHNVCLINDSFPPAIDGVANAVVNYGRVISNGLGKATVVTPFYPDADDSVFSFPVVRYPSIDMTAAVGYRAGLPFAPEIQDKLENADFDIVHSHCPITSTMLARSLRSRIDKPIVLTYHTKFDIDIANAVKSRLLREEAARLLVDNISACDEVWTVSRGAGENLRLLGYEGDYIVMPNGVDFPSGRVDEESVHEAAADYDLPEELPVFLFVGRMMWYKNIRISLEALKMLMDDGIDFRMVFIGAGADKDEIMAFSSQLGLDAKVMFVPPIHDRQLLRAWYCRADLFLFPSTFDTNGLVVREAAACSLASVLVRGSCASEDITDGVNGILIEENASSMYIALKNVCRRREYLKTLGSNACRDIYISWDDAVKNAYERYGTVIENYKNRGTHREEFSDEFFSSMGRGMDNIIKLRRMRRNAVAEILKERSEFNSDMNRAAERIRQRLDGIYSNIALEYHEGRAWVEESLEDVLRFIDSLK